MMLESRALDALYPSPGAGAAGLLIGVVTNNADPEHSGRVKLKIPVLSDTEETTWAPVLRPAAGAHYGFHALPLPGEVVLVGFEQGDVNFPFVLGSFWTAKSGPPAPAEGAQNHVTLATKNGHQIHLDDTEGAGLIEIVGQGGANRITVNTEDNTVTVQGRTKVVLASEGDLELSARGTLKIEAGMVTVESKGPLGLKGVATNIEAKGLLALKGMSIDLQ